MATQENIYLSRFFQAGFYKNCKYGLHGSDMEMFMMPDHLLNKWLSGPDPDLDPLSQPRMLSVDNYDGPRYRAACIDGAERLRPIHPKWHIYAFYDDGGRAGIRALERRNGPLLPCAHMYEKLAILDTWADFAAAYADEERLITTGADLGTAGAAALRLLPREIVQEIKDRIMQITAFPAAHLKSGFEPWHGLPCMSCFDRLDSMYQCKCKMCGRAIVACYACFVHPPICIWCEPATTIAFTGSRNWSDEAAVCDVLVQLPVDKTIIVHGACPTGLDAIVDRMARAMGFRVVLFHADWRRYGRAAGPTRNGNMLRALDVDRDPIPDVPRASVVYAFPHSDSRGTVDCIRQAEGMGIRVIVHKQLDP